MNENLRDALDNMFDARIPSLWLKISWESSTLGFWFTELLERTAQFTSWIFTARPKVFWMTGFFNPQGFLTAMRQEVTRAHKGWALDSVVLFNDVCKAFKEDITSAPAGNNIRLTFRFLHQFSFHPYSVGLPYDFFQRLNQTYYYYLT